MVYIQKNTPPPNKIHTFSLRNFAGGLNNRSDLLEDNEAGNLLNMAFSDDEIMEKRKGKEYHDTADLLTPVTFISEYKPYKEADKLIRASDTKVFVDGVELSTTGGRISGTNFVGKYFYTDGTAIFAYGKYPQASTTYEKVVGTADPNYLKMKVVNPPATFTPLTTEHKKGVVVYDYTNKTIHYEPCQNELDDAYKGANVLPENPKYIVTHNGRVYVSGSDKDNDNVFISDVRNPYYFAVALPMQLPPNSDMVRGLAVYDDSVVVGRESDIYVIQGETNNPNLGFSLFTLRRLNTHTGFASNSAVDLAHNFLFFLGSDGVVYALSSVNIDERLLSTQIISRQLDLFKSPIGITKADLVDATSYFYDGEWYLSIKDKVMIYSYLHRGWTMWNNLDARSFYDLNGVLIFGDEAGRTLKLGSTHLDLGTPFEAFWTSKNHFMDDANAQKQFREFFIVAHTFNDFKSDIRMTFEVDYDNVQGEVVIANQISIFGESVWGDRFINRNINASVPFVIGRRGRNIRFTYRNGYFPSGTVATVADLEYVSGKFEGMLYYVTGESAYYLYTEKEWVKQTTADLDQPMRVYQVNGDYEYRGKR